MKENVLYKLAYSFKNTDSQCTVTVAMSLAGVPTPLLAVH